MRQDRQVRATSLPIRPRTFLPLAVALLVFCVLALTSGAPGGISADLKPAIVPAQSPGIQPVTAKQDTLHRIDRVALFRDLSILAHDSMEGRQAGTPGAERARRFLLSAFSARGLAPVAGSFEQHFSFRMGDDEAAGANVLGAVRGRERPGRYIVVTAHFDHLGVRGNEIYNGADDNASGSAALLELARYLSRNPTRNSLLFIAFDAEEVGLRGAEAFLANSPVPIDSVLMNVNLDMVSRNEADELYAVGTRHYPALLPIVTRTAERSTIRLLTGHDSPGPSPSDDWTFASDHGPFHRRGIPFIYFGVEDHEGYHTPQDTYDAITPDFYHAAVETILDFILLVDESAEALRRP